MRKFFNGTITAPYTIRGLGDPVSRNPKSVAPRQGVRLTSFTINVNNVTSKLVIPENLARKSLLIQNLSGDTIYVNVDSPASAVPIKGIAIFTGGNYEPTDIPSNSIHVIGTVSSQDIVVFEGQ